MNERIMMFGAIVLAVIAIVLAGYSFGEVRSLGDASETMQTRISAIETAPADDDQTAQAVEDLQMQVDQLTDQVGELTERVNQITQAFEGLANQDAPGDGPAADDEDAEAEAAPQQQ